MTEETKGKLDESIWAIIAYGKRAVSRGAKGQQISCVACSQKKKQTQHLGQISHS